MFIAATLKYIHREIALGSTLASKPDDLSLLPGTHSTLVSLS